MSCDWRASFELFTREILRREYGIPMTATVRIEIPNCQNSNTRKRDKTIDAAQENQRPVTLTSAAIGDLADSCTGVRQTIPSKRTRAEITPLGLSLRWAPNEERRDQGNGLGLQLS